MSRTFAPRGRFWTDVSVTPFDQKFQILLDTKPLHTPSKAVLVLPTAGLAQAVAEEWRMQGDEIRPEAMPLTRAANSAIDKVTPNHATIARMLSGYGGTDLLCYRASEPAALVARQTALWDPWLDWMAAQSGGRLATRAGVMHIAQPQSVLDDMARHVTRLDAWRLTALHDLVVLSGSLVLALAVTKRALAAPAAWDLSCLDELWQQEFWGLDAEAEAAAQEKQDAFVSAAHMWELLEDSL